MEANNDEDVDTVPMQQQQQQQQHRVGRAVYPLPQPLAQRLRAAVFSAGPDGPQVESVTTGLELLVSNAIQALDAMYFATEPAVRKQEAFAHRLCLRVCADRDEGTLSLTDLGCGMSRADLINSLGIGRPGLMSSHGTATARRGQQRPPSRSSSSSYQRTASSTVESTDEEDDDEEEEEDETTRTDGNACSDTEEEDDDESQEDSKTEHDNDVDFARTPTNGQAAGSVATPTTDTASKRFKCLATDIGGFYAALCALGTAVKVGTKSKFDDYYEFYLGFDECSPDSAFSELQVIRPLPEGTELSVETGFNQFHSVRGESGTCVTIRLNQTAVDAGFLDENKLKSVFLKIVETTQYTVAFSSDPDAQAIIDASAKEKQAMVELAKRESEDPAVDSLEAVAHMDLGREDIASDDEYNSVKERAKYIPVRLSLGERKMLRLVEAAMNCCDYTTEVDRPFKSTARRTHQQLKGVTNILRGLVIACDYAAGHKLAQDENFTEYETFFRQMFEIARRHKIMNPEKMRTEYGKLIYVLQDAVSPTVQPHLGFSVKGPIQTVYKFLEDRDGIGLLEDKLIETATAEILAERKSRSLIDHEIRQKERAVTILKRKYKNPKLSSDDIHLCLYSICDNNSFLNSNRVPVDKIIDYLTNHFSPTQAEEGYSLSIVSGEDGARLSHNHERQYYFALQSLTLWRDIIDDMFRLWAMAEEDLLSDSITYSLQDTGQGMQRVQQSPRTYAAMQKILVRVQQKVKRWVGSSVIHLGDHNVPNALSFIDKYTQVPRILGPIVACLENLERLCDEDGGISHMIEKGFGGLEKLRKDILFDFFRSAFDGSGADNFYDAGSCIDGRLTSAWNWCSQLPDKPFYPIFKLTGFTGFDGEFK